VWSLLICAAKNSSTRLAAFGVGVNNATWNTKHGGSGGDQFGAHGFNRSKIRSS
jgi:hypothetical protein